MTGWLLTGLLLAVAAVVAMRDWRRGLLFCFWVGILQDPLRKFVPGQSVAMQMLVLVAFGFVAFSLFAKGGRLRVSDLYRGSTGFEVALKLLLIVVVLQCLHTLLAYGNPVLAGLGLTTYFAPLLAALVGWAFVRSEEDVRRLMRFYLVLAIPACLTVFISYQYPGRWDLFRDIGEFIGQQLLIYDLGTVLASHSGIFRAGEVAAWHAAMSIIFLFVLTATSKSNFMRLAAALLIIALVGVIILTGRRKMLAALVIFLGCYMAFYLLFWQARGRLGLSSLVLAMGLGAAVWTFFPTVADSPYLQRGVSVFAEGGERAGVAQDLAGWAVVRGGFFGKGAGVAAQGAQYFGGGTNIVGGSAEAGIGKIYVELGAPGAIAIVLLLVQAARWMLSLYRRTAPLISHAWPLFSGMLAAILANGITFLAATQIFGDMFVQLFLGVMFGMSLSVNKLLGRVALRPSSGMETPRRVPLA